MLYVVIPTYNEIENLDKMVAALSEHLPTVRDQWRVLVVDDNSPDGTGDLADRLAAHDPRIEVMHRAGKEGLGAAYRAGFALALLRGAEIIVQMDCDFSHDPYAIGSLVAAIDAGADVAVGSRYISGGATENWPLHRQMLSRTASLGVRGVLGLQIRDSWGGFRAISRATMLATDIGNIQANGFCFQAASAFMYQRGGFSLVEVPIMFRQRVAGTSKMNPGLVVEGLRYLPRLRYQQRRRLRRRVAVR